MVTIWSWLFRIYNLLKTIPKLKYPINKEDQVLNYRSTQHKEGLQTRAILRLKDGKIDFLIIVQCSLCASLTVIYGPIVLINRMMIDIEDHQVCLTFSFLWRCFDQFHLTWLTPPVQVLRLVESIIRLFPDITIDIFPFKGWDLHNCLVRGAWDKMAKCTGPLSNLSQKGNKKEIFLFPAFQQSWYDEMTILPTLLFSSCSSPATFTVLHLPSPAWFS